MDDGVLAAVERQGERLDLDRVASRNHLNGEVARCGCDAGRAEDASIRIHLEDVLQLVGRPVVGVLVCDDDRDYV